MKRAFQKVSVSLLQEVQRIANAASAQSQLSTYWDLSFPSAPPERVIPLDDLVVGVHDNRFYLRSLRLNKKVIVCQLHMLNIVQAPNACRFLVETASDGRPVLSSFDWGNLSIAPFLPRITIQQSPHASLVAILHSAPLLLLHQREAITDYPSSVTATVMDTFQKIQEQDDVAAHLLLFCAFLAPDAIPEILFQIWIEHQNERTYFHPQQRLQKALKVILTSSLLRRTELLGTFIMHRLVRIILRAQTKQDDQRYLEELIVRILNQSFPEIADSREIATWSLCQYLVPHIALCMVSLSGENGTLLKRGNYFSRWVFISVNVLSMLMQNAILRKHVTIG